MATCSPSAASARAALVALLVLGVGPAAAEPDAQEPASTHGRPEDALARLRKARAAQGPAGAVHGPVALPTPSNADRRRAFDALRKRSRSPAMEARARNSQQKASEALAAEHEQMTRRIGQALGLEAPDLASLTQAKAPAAKTWVPVLFVSSSMPIATLRTYAPQLERVGGVFAFRGVPGGLTKVAPMAKLSAEILRLDPGCEGPGCAMRNVQLIVDPLLFRQHAVRQVPALTMVPGDPTRAYCEREDDSPGGRHLVLGDAALSGLLEEYARLGGKEEVGDAAARLENR